MLPEVVASHSQRRRRDISYAVAAVYEGVNELPEREDTPPNLGGEFQTPNCQFIHTFYERRFFLDQRKTGGHRPPLQLNSFCRRRRLTVGAWSRPAHKHFFPVKIFHKNADALTLSTLGLVCEDLDLRSDR